jgi:hypothetical protein
VRAFTGSAFDLTGERRRTEYRIDTARRRLDESFERKDWLPLCICPSGDLPGLQLLIKGYVSPATSPPQLETHHSPELRSPMRH